MTHFQLFVLAFIVTLLTLLGAEFTTKAWTNLNHQLVERR